MKIRFTPILSFLVLSIILSFSYSGYAQIENPPMTRDQAIELILRKICPPAQHEGPVSIFLHSTLVNPGDIIRPFSNESSKIIHVQSPSWFSWIDDHPTAHFAHPTRVVLIDIQTGKWTVTHYQWWPELNGKNIFMSDAVRNNPEINIYSDLNTVK